MRRSILAVLAVCALAATLIPGMGAAKPGAARPVKAAGAKTLFADFVPPAPFMIVVKQPDETTFKTRLTPAEVGGNLETEDGFTVTKGAGGWWYYAKSARVDVLKASKLRAGRNSWTGTTRSP